MDRILEPPAYGWEKDGELVRPSKKEIFREFLRRTNVFHDRKNWLSLWSWITTLSFAYPLFIFVTQYFSFPLLLAGFLYSMVGLGTFGTVWFHRYCTHGAFQFRNAFFREIVRNLVIKIIPDEIYVVSHHVHHKIPEKPGDPYNVHAGWLYCFLADVNHQPIRRDLNEPEYKKLCRMVEHSGVRFNSFAAYKKWGSLCHPFWTILHYVLNWSFWYGAFFLLGGHALATALFGATGFWAVGIRTFNYDGHGRGVDKRREGIDFNTKDWSINQVWPGYVAGEWHNNHHLYPNSARSGFLPYQFDLAWVAIKTMSSLGIVTSYRDYQSDFMKHYYEPYLAKKSIPASVPEKQTEPLKT